MLVREMSLYGTNMVTGGHPAMVTEGVVCAISNLLDVVAQKHLALFLDAIHAVPVAMCFFERVEE